MKKNNIKEKLRFDTAIIFDTFTHTHTTLYLKAFETELFKLAAFCIFLMITKCNISEHLTVFKSHISF